jgi:hypothetical protein
MISTCCKSDRGMEASSVNCCGSVGETASQDRACRLAPAPSGVDGLENRSHLTSTVSAPPKHPKPGMPGQPQGCSFPLQPPLAFAEAPLSIIKVLDWLRQTLLHFTTRTGNAAHQEFAKSRVQVEFPPVRKKLGEHRRASTSATIEVVRIILAKSESWLFPALRCK